MIINVAFAILNSYKEGVQVMANVKHELSVARQVKLKVLGGGSRSWSTADFPDLPATAVTAALRRLAKVGELRQIRQGVYWRGAKYRFGMSLPDSIQLAKTLTKVNGVGWAGLSASNVLGLTTQVPSVETIAVPISAPRPIQGVKFVARPSKHRRNKMKLNPIEVAALETLSDWESVIDVKPSEAVDSLANYVINGVIRPEKIAEAAADEKGPTRDRLRVVLTRAGHQDLVDGIRPSSTVAVTRKALAGVS